MSLPDVYFQCLRKYVCVHMDLIKPLKLEFSSVRTPSHNQIFVDSLHPTDWLPAKFTLALASRVIFYSESHGTHDGSGSQPTDYSPLSILQSIGQTAAGSCQHSRSLLQVSSKPMTKIFCSVLHKRFINGAYSSTRGGVGISVHCWVWLSAELLLVLASTVILGSESHVTHDHI
jgi:hypothetical protein